MSDGRNADGGKPQRLYGDEDEESSSTIATEAPQFDSFRPSPASNSPEAAPGLPGAGVFGDTEAPTALRTFEHARAPVRAAADASAPKLPRPQTVIGLAPPGAGAPGPSGDTSAARARVGSPLATRQPGAVPMLRFDDDDDDDDDASTRAIPREHFASSNPRVVASSASRNDDASGAYLSSQGGSNAHLRAAFAETLPPKDAGFMPPGGRSSREVPSNPSVEAARPAPMAPPWNAPPPWGAAAVQAPAPGFGQPFSATLPAHTVSPFVSASESGAAPVMTQAGHGFGGPTPHAPMPLQQQGALSYPSYSGRGAPTLPSQYGLVGAARPGPRSPLLPRQTLHLVIIGVCLAIFVTGLVLFAVTRP